MSKEFEDLNEIKRACRKVDSGVAGDTLFMYKCFTFICQQLAEINEKLSRKKRKPSAFNKFVAKKCKKGGKMSLQEAVALWNKQKRS